MVDKIFNAIPEFDGSNYSQWAEKVAVFNVAIKNMDKEDMKLYTEEILGLMLTNKLKGEALKFMEKRGVMSMSKILETLAQVYKSKESDPGHALNALAFLKKD